MTKSRIEYANYPGEKTPFLGSSSGTCSIEDHGFIRLPNRVLTVCVCMFVPCLSVLFPWNIEGSVQFQADPSSSNASDLSKGHLSPRVDGHASCVLAAISNASWRASNDSSFFPGPRPIPLKWDRDILDVSDPQLKLLWRLLVRSFGKRVFIWYFPQDLLAAEEQKIEAFSRPLKCPQIQFAEHRDLLLKWNCRAIFIKTEGRGTSFEEFSNKETGIWDYLETKLNTLR